MKTINYFLLLSVISYGCFSGIPKEDKENLTKKNTVLDPKFNEYWYDGNAEITSYELMQERYGEVRKGNAVLIFVTEPFSEKKQVKLDDCTPDLDNKTVLKLNFIKKFITGIYPYSLMFSSFTPVETKELPNMLKITTSCQEWCGHTFLQLNKKKKEYLVSGNSYFESEGDISEKIALTTTEDELWSRIRMNPKTLPEGKMKILPSSFYVRLSHKKFQPVESLLELKEVDKSKFKNETHYEYTVEYPERELRIYFEKKFPYDILGWNEIRITTEGREIVASGRRIKKMKIPYWNQNKNENIPLRKDFQLPIY